MSYQLSFVHTSFDPAVFQRPDKGPSVDHLWAQKVTPKTPATSQLLPELAQEEVNVFGSILIGKKSDAGEGYRRPKFDMALARRNGLETSRLHGSDQ
ncbi:MAG TPA: hypothetical protein VGL53_23935 [Bryobacteraceae bacterium]